MQKIKNKGGAPRKEIRQSKAFKVYLTLEEFSRIKSLSEELGYPTISGLIREKILEFSSRGRISTANNPMIQAASAYLGEVASACAVLEQFVDQFEVPDQVFDVATKLRSNIEKVDSFLIQ